MASSRHDHDERLARIDLLIEELRANTEDLHGHAKDVLERARKKLQDTRAAIVFARQTQAQDTRRKR